MSEQQNLELVRHGYACFDRGDLDELMTLFDEQIEWVTPGPSDVPIAGRRRGHRQVREFFDQLTKMVEMGRFEPKEFLAQGDRVVVTGDETFRMKASGHQISMPWAHVFQMRDAKVVRFEEYADMTAIAADLCVSTVRA
jgi:ketosteroid isomerase-like protein